MPTIILTHADVDGALAASVLLAGVSAEWAGDPVRFSSYQQLENELRAILAETNVNELYLTDLDIREISQTTFDELITRARLHLVDHHALSALRTGQIEKSGGTCWVPSFGEQVCSTELAIRAIGERAAERLRLIAEAARADDFNDPTVPEAAQRLARNLGAALIPSSGLRANALVLRLAAEIRDTLVAGPQATFALSQQIEHWLRKAADAVERKQLEARDALQIELFEIRSRFLGNLCVACARVPDVLLGKPGVEAIQSKRPEADVAAAFFDDGACWAFPRGFPHGRVNLVPVLEALGGGGRDGAGGFGFRGATNEQNYSGRLAGFVRVLETYGNETDFELALGAIPALRSGGSVKSGTPNPGSSLL